MERKADAYLEGEKVAQHGKKPNHKIKPYVVLQYLLKNTDENHVATAPDIVAYLQECGIEAERRSIYRDIKEINYVALMLEEDCMINEAREMVECDDDDENKLVIYDCHRKGFYARRRDFEMDDIRLLAECVYSAKFVNEGQAKRLVKVVSQFVSDHQAEQIKHSVLRTDRVKTNNKQVLNNISLINKAMSRKIEGVPHKPEKIRFKYLKHTIRDVNQQVERRKGESYVVNPFLLLINDGNYYLLSIDERTKKERTYRVDRMKDVELTGIEREGDDEFKKVDVKNYSQRVFSMYGGKLARITLQCINPLLDTMVERFGTNEVQYMKVDEDYFSVSAKVEVSDQFFGWLLGFGRRVKLTGNDEVVKKFTAYLDKVREMY